MDPNSPFAGDVPIIGQPSVLSMVAVVLMQCNCEDKSLIMGAVGGAPFSCPSCKKSWVLQAQVQIGIQQIASREDGLITN